MTSHPPVALLNAHRNNTPTYTRLHQLDKAIWRCGCGSWRWGSRACTVCALLLEAEAS